VKQGSSLQTSSSFTAIKVKTGKGGDTPALLARRCTALEYVLVAIGADWCMKRREQNQCEEEWGE